MPMLIEIKLIVDLGNEPIRGDRIQALFRESCRCARRIDFLSTVGRKPPMPPDVLFGIRGFKSADDLQAYLGRGASTDEV